MIQFVNPAFLWGFLGLSIPIAIHLLNRREGKVIRVGSLRHIQETSTRQFRSIKLNELVLLALRCLLISLLALLLAGTTWGSLKESRKWVLIEPGMQHDSGLMHSIDSLEQDGYEVRMLSSGFPLLGSDPNVQIENYPVLVEELARMPSTSVIVFSYNFATGFSGKRLALPPNVRWLEREGAWNKKFPVYAVQNADSVYVRLAHASAGFTEMESVRIAGRRSSYAESQDSVPVIQPRTVKIILVSDKNFSRDKEIMIKVLSAVKSSAIGELEWREGIVKDIDAEKYDWLIWLSDSPAPGFDGRLLDSRIQDVASLLIQIDSKHFSLTQHINRENVVEKNLVVNLYSLFFDLPEARANAVAGDRRTIDNRMSWSGPMAGVMPGEVEEITSSPTGRFLIILLILTLTAERFLAYRRDQ